MDGLTVCGVDRGPPGAWEWVCGRGSHLKQPPRMSPGRSGSVCGVPPSPPTHVRHVRAGPQRHAATPALWAGLAISPDSLHSLLAHAPCKPGDLRRMPPFDAPMRLPLATPHLRATIPPPPQRPHTLLVCFPPPGTHFPNEALARLSSAGTAGAFIALTLDMLACSARLGALAARASAWHAYVQSGLEAPPPCRQHRNSSLARQAGGDTLRVRHRPSPPLARPQ